MKLYHGSKRIVNSPIPHGSKITNDYGPGFYLTPNLESAHEWACRNNSVGYVNEFDLNIEGLKVLDLRDSDNYSILNWLAILLHFRTLRDDFIKAFGNRLNYIQEHYYIDISEYDLIIGYRADDAYFRFPIDFVRGNLTLDQLEQSYMLGDLGIQYVLISEKGIRHLKYIDSYLSLDKYIGQYYQNVTSATARFDGLSKDQDGIRIQDIMRESK